MKELVGKQKVHGSLEEPCLRAMRRYMNMKGNMDIEVSSVPLSQLVEIQFRFEDFINVVPKNTRAVSVAQLKLEMIRDTRADVQHFPEYDLIAVVGKSDFDRPILEVEFDDGSTRFFLHPDYKKCILRL